MALSRALGDTLYRLPKGVRGFLPRTVREAVRRRVGPFAPWEAGFAHATPLARPAEVVGAPDFVGIGVQKAGTTWWWELLIDHPQVFHRPDIHKERHYFARFALDRFGPEEIRAYHAWFPRPQGAVTGEWTPDYFSQPWVPPLLSRAAPDTRLIVMLRDPVERFESGLAHSEMTSASHLGTVATDAFARGLYADSLRAWSKHFRIDKMLVLQYECCVVDPKGQLARTYRFLGLDEDHHPGGLSVPRNPTVEKVSLDPEARTRLAKLYAADVAETASLVQGLDTDMWPNFART